MYSWIPFTVEKISSRAGLGPGTARSEGQRLTQWATGVPSKGESRRVTDRFHGIVQIVGHIGKKINYLFFFFFFCNTQSIFMQLSAETCISSFFEANAHTVPSPTHVFPNMQYIHSLLGRKIVFQPPTCPTRILICDLMHHKWASLITRLQRLSIWQAILIFIIYYIRYRI